MVSVIIPIYNAETWLHQSVNSIINQTYKDWELILVDDGSTDSSLEVCNKFALSNSKIKVIHKSNGGVTSARYFGLRSSKGQFVVFLDADDMLYPSALQILLDYQNNYLVDIVKCNEEILYGKIKTKMSNKHIGVLDKGNFIKCLLLGEVISTLHATLFSRFVLTDEVFMIEPKFKIGEDVLMNIQAANNCQTAYVGNEIIYGYAYNEKSVMQTQVMSFEYNQSISNKIFQSVKEKTPEVFEIEKRARVIHLIKSFFVPEIEFSFMRYKELVRYLKNDPNGKNELLKYIDSKYLKFSDYKYLYLLYSKLYKAYILYFKQKGRKKKVIY